MFTKLFIRGALPTTLTLAFLNFSADAGECWIDAHDNKDRVRPCTGHES
jgi:hypothetical protein